MLCAYEPCVGGHATWMCRAAPACPAGLLLLTVGRTGCVNGVVKSEGAVHGSMGQALPPFWAVMLSLPELSCLLWMSGFLRA
jgi:hypothetical protein